MKASSLPFSILIFVYSLVLISWTIYRSSTQLPEYIDELLAKPLIWITPVIFVIFWRKIKFSSFGFITPNIKIVLISAATGIILSLLQIVPNLLKESSQIVDFQLQLLPLIVLTYIGTAISEEILFRGFILQQLKRKLSSFISVTLSSFLFAVIHLPILLIINQLSGLSLIFGIYVIFVSGVAFGILFLRFKTIWAPIIAHLILDLLLTIF